MTAPATRTATIDGATLCDCDSCLSPVEVSTADAIGLAPIYCALCRALGVGEEDSNETAARVAAGRR